MLHEHLQEMYGLEFIKTEHLTQNNVERQFGKVRGAGGFNLDPSALQCMYRVRKQLISTLLEVEYL